MMKAGLLALAESYGLERGATQTLGRLGERFFELLGENFESLVAQRVKLLGLSQSVESFADFCTAAPSQHTLVCGVAGRPAMAFRIDHALTLGLVDGVLGKYDAPSSESAESPLTVTERRILVSVLKSALGAVAPLVFPALFADLLPAATVLQIIGARDEAGVIADTLEPAEPLIAMTAPYVINGRRGAIALGLT
ncbi:MAG: hypothetical protein ACREQC_10345, partial [Candidatus Binataceae bacterium]